MKTLDVAIVGGGAAGLAAALTLWDRGVRDILIIEREHSLGGILRQCIHEGFGLIRFGENLSGPEYARRFIEEIEKRVIPYCCDTAVTDISPQKVLTLVSRREGLVKIQTKAVILTMGCRERTRGQLAIPGERPAGVFTAGVAQAYMNLYNTKLGNDVVILGSGDVGLIMARRLTLEGSRVKGVYEILPHPSGLPRNIAQCLDDYGIPLYLSHTVTEIVGDRRINGVKISAVDKDLQAISGTERFVSCDTLILSVGLIPENELSAGAGVILDEKTKGALVDGANQTNVPGIFAAGNARYVHDLVDNVSLDGEKTALAAAAWLKGTLSASLIPANPDSASSETPRFFPKPGARLIRCILCPNGCDLEVVAQGEQILSVTGNRCPKGVEYAESEIRHPMRTFASSVSVEGGELPLVSVRLSAPVPRDRIFDVMEEIKKIRLKAPVRIGDIACKNVLGLESDVVVTKTLK
ncbi:MAG: FAD-dependent oxidoreductase [Fusobacteriaceae bacterium]|jgi:CxxC motif-containing protein/NADPH-dependent 2,4-dienoyl-CoA reductase/sulfur reductase-like enzyme|nr:FAD-dependent oxidoreductase [Fusobacteriaceae bacterium]